MTEQYQDGAAFGLATVIVWLTIHGHEAIAEEFKSDLIENGYHERVLLRMEQFIARYAESPAPLPPPN